METKVQKFVDWLNKEYGETISEYSWSKYKYSKGKKYFRIIRESGPKSASVYGFVDMLSLPQTPECYDIVNDMHQKKLGMIMIDR